MKWRRHRTSARRPVPFDADMPYRMHALGTTWVRCTGCDQPNHHAQDRFAWRDEQADAKGGRVHVGRHWMRTWAAAAADEDYAYVCHRKDMVG